MSDLAKFELLAKRVELFRGVEPENVGKIFAKGITIDLSSFLKEGEYKTVLVRDEKGNAATVSLVRKRETFGPRPGVIVDTTSVKSNDSFFVELLAGGGFVALISK